MHNYVVHMYMLLMCDVRKYVHTYVRMYVHTNTVCVVLTMRHSQFCYINQMRILL